MDKLSEEFLRAYYDAGDRVDQGCTWKETRWMGVPVQKLPMDLWLYQEILFSDRPDLIIECGTAFGGSALYMAHLLDLLGHGSLVSVDIADWDLEYPGYEGRPQHPRITYIRGSSTDPSIVAQVQERAGAADRVMVILDSDHSEKHVYDEMLAYGPLVTPGMLMIVEDTMLNAHPVHADFGPGPMEARDRYLQQSSEFDHEPMEEKLMISFNPRGYLRRRGSADTSEGRR